MATPTSFSPWIERIVQLLHDPPGKIRYLARHEALAKKLADELADMKFSPSDWENLVVPRADCAAAGADRPCVPRGVRQNMFRADTLMATHPLGDRTVCPPLRLGHADGASVNQSKAAPAVGKRERDDQFQAALGLARELVGAADKERYYAVWRRLRDELIKGRDPEWAQPDSHPRGDVFWSMLPADTRCPDVSIWDHTRVTAALSFMSGTAKQSLPPEREPYLLKVSLTPVQTFIGMARTSRDLWLGSMLLAELAFQAMTPFIEQYGPTCILYPDLRANPRMDLWLKDQDMIDALPEGARDPSSFAALVPNSFVAVVPRGRTGDSEVPDLGDLAAKAEQQVRKRWETLQQIVRRWLTTQLGASPHWQAIWDRQHREADVIRTRWVAVPWLPGGKQTNYRFGPIFPYSDRHVPPLPAETPADTGIRQVREQRLLPWVPAALWQISETTRGVFGRANNGILNCERGFDFAVTHAMLRSVHDARKQVASWPKETAETGVKCTLCGLRSALTEAPAAGAQGVDSLTETARIFWSDKRLDPDGTGAERLCAVCAMRRFAVEADANLEGINHVWATEVEATTLGTGPDKPRVPFPSTSAIAAQAFLLELVRRATPDVIAAARRVVDAHRNEGLTPTQFSRALVRLALAEAIAKERDPSGALTELLRIEPQECLYPDALHSQLAMRRRRSNATGPRRSSVTSSLENAVSDLLTLAKDRLDLKPPGSRIAVVKVDGDSLGRLIEGDPDAVGARWSDVLHPDTLEKILADPTCQQAGWPLLADVPRMTGPSLNAFISRTLGEFAHRIVPWVVECEFAGRLIYAGGDDVLALVPVDQALDLAARLQQLYSAHWVIDTQHEEDAWFWRRKRDVERDLGTRLDTARGRFVIPLPATGQQHLDWPISRRAPHSADARQEAVAVHDVAGPVIPMLASRQSLSAGIVYANMKDALGGLVLEAGRVLDHEAKAIEGKAAVALVDRSRGGAKRAFAMKWDPGGRDALGVPRAHRLLKTVAREFERGRLPSRLPYKLREVARALEPIFETQPDRLLAPQPGQPRLLRNSIEANLEQEVHQETLDDVEELWKAGWGSYQRARKRQRARKHQRDPGLVDHTLDGLLIALSLVEEDE
jgi:CRISPR-associated protein Cmr2